MMHITKCCNPQNYSIKTQLKNCRLARIYADEELEKLNNYFKNKSTFFGWSLIKGIQHLGFLLLYCIDV